MVHVLCGLDTHTDTSSALLYVVGFLFHPYTSLPRRDSDNRSTSSRQSARDMISNFISRSRSRQSSQEPGEGLNGTETNGEKAGGDAHRVSRRRSFLGASGGSADTGDDANGAKDVSRRMSVRIPGLRKKSSVPNNRQRSMGATNNDEAPPVPPLSDEHADAASTPSTGSRKAKKSSAAAASPPTISNGVEHDTSVPEHPHRPKGNGKQERKGQQQGVKERKGILGGATAAVAGAGAAAGGAAAALASKATGKTDDAGKGKENGDRHYGDYSDESDDDVFHDADLDDIAEGEGEDDDQTDNDQQKDAESARPRSTSGKSGSNHGRHRGLSEGEGMALGAGATGGAAAAARRSGSSKKSDEADSQNRPVSKRSSSSKTPSQLRGTSGAKRRSGSAPVGDEKNTPVDQKAREETPVYVREKAARVRKLTYDDVSMSESEMRADIKAAREALHLFLNSRMIEAEEIIAKYSDRKLYYALGDAIIAVIKGFMTFEPEDLAKAISYCKDALHIASLLRKQSNTVSSFGRFVRGTGHGPSTMASMDAVQRHAELVYAEGTLLKSVMGILYSGDFFGFVAEALSMRNAYGIYRSLSKYVEWADEKAGGRDEKIDEDFRSGVFLGNGLISMILGLLPGKVLKIMEVFGYSGDTAWALKTLARAGEWSKDKSEPGMPVNEEGIRRQICDMSILLYHLVISTFIPVTGVDIDFADKVLHYNLERYPQGVFFLYFSGRLYSTQSLAEKAVVQFRAARDVQREYVQLQHICVWDMSLCHMSLTQYDYALDCFEILYKDSNWSKCVYSYGRAANMWSAAGNDKALREEASKIFHEVPGKMQRIAGKSIPMEKYCARKAKKFIHQKRLLMPAIEFSYIYHCLTNAPQYSLSDNQLVEVSEALQEINEVQDPSEYHSGADEYWDDYCLAHFLRGVTLRYIAYPEAHAKVQKSKNQIPQREASEQSGISLRNVIEASHRLSLDHYICFFAHYELGRLLASQGDKSGAREHYDMVMSGKPLEANPGKGSKYSMKNMCTLRTNGALEIL